MISEKHDFTVLGGLRHNKIMIFFKEEKDNISLVELGKMFIVFKNSPLLTKYPLQIKSQFSTGLSPKQVSQKDLTFF